MDAKPSGSPLVRIAQGLALTLASLLLCALVLEVGLRLFWDGYYQKFDPEHPWGEFVFNPTRGWSLGPDFASVDWDTDFKVMRLHNSHGLRNPEIAVEKPAGKTRVLAIGDSFVYGNGVENEEAFPRVLESLVPSLQVINAGVPLYSGAEELVALREEIAIWKPDIVIAAYFWNDLFGAYPGRYLQFQVKPDGSLHLDPPDPPTDHHPAFDFHWRRHEKRVKRYHFIARNSYAWRLLSDRIKVFTFITRSWWDALVRSLGDEREQTAVDRSQEEPAWELSLALLEEMSRVARDHDARFLLLVIPDQAQVEPDVDVYDLPPYLDDVQERVVSFAESHDIPVLDPLPALREIRLKDGMPQYFPNDRHWNAVGHRHMAELLRDELRRRGWVGARG